MEFLDQDDFDMLDILIDELHELVEQGNVQEAVNLSEHINSTYELS